ncbi:MAG: ribosome small subunit-dependent GTPase A [Limnochordaceae bacterium]|nr:ribosome small subunit-dependent GTPase A [Limnochordaceae bacterium]
MGEAFPRPALVLRCLGGFAYIQLEDGRRAVARPLGRLRRQGRLVVGDRVQVIPVTMQGRDEQGQSGGTEEAIAGLPPASTAHAWPGEAPDWSRVEYAICEVEPRQHQLERPLVANIDQVLLVHPLPLDEAGAKWIDRLTVIAQQREVRPVITLSKADLATPAETSRWAKLYAEAGFPVAVTSVRSGQGAAELYQLLKGHITALAGPSGAGKTSLVNWLIPGLHLPTGELSRRTGRGRQTTREAQLLPLPGGSGWIADTPGFGALPVPIIDPYELARYFPEFGAAGSCPYPGCLHVREPACTVRAAVASGRVASVRYQHYLELLGQAQERWAHRFTHPRSSRNKEDGDA